jgi:hypothetical protein
LLGIIVVHSAEQCDGSCVMDEAMDLGNVVEMVPDSKIDKNIFVLMELVQHCIHCLETFCCMHRILRKINKIKECSHKAHQVHRRPTTQKSQIHHDSKKDASNVFPFLTGEPFEPSEPILEVPGIVVWWETAAMCVDLIASKFC